MWRALGPNLDEKNAARIAGTLESMENILTGIDKDCKLSNRSSFRCIKKKEDLVSIDAFQYILLDIGKVTPRSLTLNQTCFQDLTTKSSIGDQFMSNLIISQRH